MVFTESAKVLSTDELRELADEECQNPTVDRLVFLETRDKEGRPGKIFPMFLEGWKFEDELPVTKPDPKTGFQFCIMQSMGGTFSLLRVVIHSEELGISKRIWDKPPTKGRRDDEKWVENSVVQ